MRPSAGARTGESPTGAEWWLGLAAVLATMLLPALEKTDMSQEASKTSLIVEVVWTLVYALTARQLFVHREAAVSLLRRSKLLWAFILLMILSTLWSVNPFLSFKNAVELAGTTVVATYLVVRYPLRPLIGLVALAFGIVSALSIFLVAFSPGRGRMDWGGGPWSGIFQEKNHLGIAMVLAIITLAPWFLSARGRARFLGAAGILLCAALLAGSRSATAFAAGLAAIALGLLAWMWCSSRVFGRVAVIGIATAAVALVMVFGFHPDAAMEALGRDSSMSGRTDFWPYLMNAIGDRPILGFGYKAFFRSPEGDSYLSTYQDISTWVPYHAHNSFLQIWLDAGILGVGLLAAIIIVGLVRAVRLLAAKRSIEGAWPLMVILCLGLGSYSETYLGNYNTFEWILFVAAILYPVRAALGVAADSGRRDLPVVDRRSTLEARAKHLAARAKQPC